METEKRNHWIREEVFPSQLATQIYDNFCVRVLRNQDGSINKKRYENIEGSIPLKSISNASIIHCEDDIIVGEELYESIDYITLIIYADGISINGKQIIPLGDTVKSSALIPANNRSKEDSLILSLGESSTVVLRFCLLDNDNYEIIVLDQISLTFSTLVVNERGTKAVGIDFFKIVSIIDIEYLSTGVPALELRRNLLSPANNIAACILQISDSDDLFVNVTHTFDKITKVQCYSNLENVCASNLDYKEHIMKNTFEMPLFLIPLKNTKSVLFLQSNGCTLKGSCILMTGSGDDQQYLQYPNGIKIDSYYIPKTPINILSMDAPTSNMYGHDQVLVSASPKNSLYLIDIYFHHSKGGFRITMKRLFSSLIPLSIFSLSPFGHEQYKLTFSSINGVSESRIVELTEKREYSNDNESSSLFSLKYIEKIFALTNTLPIFDFCLIDNNNYFTSSEHPQQELWCIAGAGANNSLMNLRKGFVCNKTRLSSSLPSIDILKPFFSSSSQFILASSETSSWITQLHEKDSADMDIDESQTLKFDSITALEGSFKEEPTLIFNLLENGCYIRVTSSNIIFGEFDSFKELSVMHVNERINIAANFNQNVFIATASRIQWFVFNGNSFVEMPFNMEMALDPNFITMLYLEGLHTNTYLFIGYLNSIYCFQLEDGDLKLSSAFQFTNMQLPYQMKCLNIETGKYLITSYDGYYTFANYNFKNPQWSLQPEIKLSDRFPLRIIGWDHKTGILFLSGEQCWRININHSMYAKPIIINESKNRTSNSACIIQIKKDYHRLLLNRLEGFALIDVPLHQSQRIKKYKTPSPTIKMFHSKYLKTFFLVPIIDRNQSDYQKQDKLYFFDSKFRKFSDWKNDDAFKVNEYIQYVSDWQLETDNGYLANRILIGCRVENQDGAQMTGSIKICNIKIDDGKVSLEVLYHWNEDAPITCISWYEKNKLIYSSGSKVFEREYNPQKKGLESKELKFSAPSTVKRFEISNDRILMITANDSFLVCRIPSFEMIRGGDATQYLGDSIINSFDSKRYELLLGDAQDSSIVLYNEPSIVHNNDNLPVFVQNDIKYKVGSFPRITKSLNFGAWLSYKDKQSICQHTSFLTIGMGGQVDFFSSVDDAVFEKLKKIKDFKSRKGKLETVTTKWTPELGFIIDITHLRTMKTDSLGNQIHGTEIDKVLNRFMI